MARPTEPAPRRQALVVAVVGVAIYAVVVLVFSASHGGNAEWFMKFGTGSAVTTYGRQVLGDDLQVPYDEAQDGTSFWVLARDPLLVDTGPVTTYTDRPAYRADRILYPVLAAPFRLFGEQGLAWGLVIVNLGVVFVGGYLTTLLALRIGAPHRAGFAFAFNPLVIAAIALDLADALALLLLVGLVLAARERRWAIAIACAMAAVLARESSMLAVAAVAIGVSGASWRQRVSLVGLPAFALAMWAAYVRLRVGTSSTQLEEVTLVPFGGYVEAWRLGWTVQHSWGDAFVAVLLVAIAVVVVVRWWRRRTLELWAALPYAVLAPFLSGQVLHWGMNSVRAIGPAITFLVLDLLAGHANRSNALLRSGPEAVDTSQDRNLPHIRGSISTRE